MKNFGARPIGWGVILISLVLVSAFGCTTLPPAQPSQDLKRIVGKWAGPLTTGYTGQVLSMTVMINEDGTWEGFVPASRIFGTLRVSEGKFIFTSATTGTMGTCTLHEGDGRRVLVWDDGINRAQLTPAGK